MVPIRLKIASRIEVCNRGFESKFEKNASFASIFQDKVLLLDMTLFDMDGAREFQIFLC